MTTREPASQDVSTAAAAYQDAGETRRLRAGRLRFFRTIAESVGVQGPTAGVVIAPAVLASVSGGGTALVVLVAAVAMGFVAYAFVISLPAASSWPRGVSMDMPSARHHLPLAYPPLRRGIANSPLLRAGAGALLGTPDSAGDR